MRNCRQPFRWERAATRLRRFWPECWPRSWRTALDTCPPSWRRSSALSRRACTWPQHGAKTTAIKSAAAYICVCVCLCVCVCVCVCRGDEKGDGLGGSKTSFFAVSTLPRFRIEVGHIFSGAATTIKEDPKVWRAGCRVVLRRFALPLIDRHCRSRLTHALGCIAVVPCCARK